MDAKHTEDQHLSMTVAVSRSPRRRSRCAATAALAVAAALAVGHGSAAAGPLDGPGARAATRFSPAPAVPPVVAARLEGAPASAQIAVTPQGTFYAATDRAGKARVWLVRNDAIAAEVTAPPSRERMFADWAGSFVFALGALPVVAVSWKFGGDAYGIEDFGFWAVQGGGRSLGALPGSTRSACVAGEVNPGKDCGRCSSASGIPIDLRLVAVEADRARFVQQRAATWYYYLGTAGELFEQDFVLTASGLVPDGAARRIYNTMPLPLAKERIKGLLREYFRLAKLQSRPSIAPEFLTCFQQIAEVAPDFGQAHYNVGCMHALLGNHKEAVTAITRSLSLEPSYRKLARKDPDLASVRDDPELARVLGEPGK
jgi:hypothetical protein